MAGETTSTKTYKGRTRIVVPSVAVTRENVEQLVGYAWGIHAGNKEEITYLYDYYKGVQPVLRRTNPVREEINNPVVENRAAEIVDFKVGYLMGEPVAYVQRVQEDGETADKSADISRLNDVMALADKASCDRDLCKWWEIAGTSYRATFPAEDIADDGCDCPVEMVSLDPRWCYVAYDNSMWHRPAFASKSSIDPSSGRETQMVYTATAVFVLEDGHLVSERPNPLGRIPIVEYPANSERMGAFERVLSLLDAINEVESNRVDGIQQFVQALTVFENVELGVDDDEKLATWKALKREGAVEISSTKDMAARVYMLQQELNQQGTQTFVDHLYSTVLHICGMPMNLGGGASTSDTGVAVVMRDGWSLAETRAKEEELTFKRSERETLRILLHVLNHSERGFELHSRDVEVHFTRMNYEAIQSKAQVFSTLKGAGLAPKLVFQLSGMFTDPESALRIQQDYEEELSAQSGAGIDAGNDGDSGNGDTVAGNGDATPDNKANRQ